MAPVEENNEEPDDVPDNIPDNIPDLLIQLEDIVGQITDSNLRVECLKHDIADLTRDLSNLDARIKTLGTTSVTYDEDCNAKNHMRGQIMQYHRDMANWSVVNLNFRVDYTQILMNNLEVHDYIPQSLRI